MTIPTGSKEEMEGGPELPCGAKIAAPDLGAPVDGPAIPNLPPKRTYHGHDAYCHVCWEAVYLLWADPEPPDYSACPLGPYTAQTCPNAVAGSRSVKVSLEVEKRALELWREREAGFPQRVRRMNPDNLDRASGAWEIIRKQAVREVLFGKRPDQSAEAEGVGDAALQLRESPTLPSREELERALREIHGWASNMAPSVSATRLAFREAMADIKLRVERALAQGADHG